MYLLDLNPEIYKFQIRMQIDFSFANEVLIINVLCRKIEPATIIKLLLLGLLLGRAYCGRLTATLADCYIPTFSLPERMLIRSLSFLFTTEVNLLKYI